MYGCRVVLSPLFDGKQGAVDRFNEGRRGYRLARPSEKFAARKLGWKPGKLASAILEVRSMRDKLIAHYDGDAASYQEHPSGVLSMSIVGHGPNEPQANQIEEIATAMYEFLDDKLFPE